MTDQSRTGGATMRGSSTCDLRAFDAMVGAEARFSRAWDNVRATRPNGYIEVELERPDLVLPLAERQRLAVKRAADLGEAVRAMGEEYRRLMTELAAACAEALAMLGEDTDSCEQV